MSDEARAEEFRSWERIHALPLRSTWRPHTNDPSPERKLRIGYVSPDFRDHVVGRTLLPCFEAHDPGTVELYCYSSTTNPDAYTALFPRSSAAWRDTARLTDEKLAEQIRTDKIDILMDLSLHTAFNRLTVFARKPAPVQIAWLGYPGSTGLAAMDCRITDRYLEPEGSTSPALFETPLRLPDCWCSFCAPEGSPEPGDLPALRGGCVTFGSFNNLAKINPRVFALWARVLQAVEGSRLQLILSGGSRERVLRIFGELGIAGDRIECLSYYPPAPAGSQTRQPLDYLKRYQRIDIALDPFPYNGMTTTCDALWMGVPVVALIGATPMSRASFSLLSNMRLPELAAEDEEGYVRIASQLAGDLPRLSALRATLRERMKASPLLDASRLARSIETAFRDAWRKWCAGQRGAPAPL